MAVEDIDFPYSDVPDENSQGARGMSDQTSASLIDNRYRQLAADLKAAFDKVNVNVNDLQTQIDDLLAGNTYFTALKAANIEIGNVSSSGEISFVVNTRTLKFIPSVNEDVDIVLEDADGTQTILTRVSRDGTMKVPTDVSVTGDIT